MSFCVSFKTIASATCWLVVGVTGGFVAGWALHPTVPASVSAPLLRREKPSVLATRKGRPRPEPSTAPAAAWDEGAWSRLAHQPGSPAREASRATLLEALAAQAPSRALALAQAEPNRLLQRQLLTAMLRGWARTAPLDAGRWALSTNFDFREAALSAVFASAVAVDPDAAVRTGLALLQMPEAADAGCGGHLVTALCHAGEFERAAQVAGRVDSAAERNGLLGEAYARWAIYQPDQAAASALVLADPTNRARALQGVIGGWSDANPAAAVTFASELPTDERDPLVGQALLRWAKTDLKAASDWINARDPNPAMDRGVATIATQDYMKPDIALSWAESVMDPSLRSETVSIVVRRWATTDVGAAKQYLEASPALLPEDRRELEGWIATLHPPSS